jgi:CRP-like cAMP-binding protein/class 3 adenylate cyclase
MSHRTKEREVVIIMADMVKYSEISSGMSPDEIRDFLMSYHGAIHDLMEQSGCGPLEIEQSGGDGSLIIFDKKPGEDRSGICTRALEATLRVTEAIHLGTLTPTRMGVLLGTITEARIGNTMAKFGTSFAAANRLEELCGFFGTHFLMDREVARYQQGYSESVVNIAKVSLASVLHPLNLFTVYRPGVQGIPVDVDREMLQHFITRKNGAMEYFCGNLQLGLMPDFPRVREELLGAQQIFLQMTGKTDTASERILEYVRETPFPARDFKNTGMKLMEKKRDSLGERLFRLPSELLRAMDPEIYESLVSDTGWERYFKLEWFKEGEVIVRVGSVPDGIYYQENGTTETYNERGELLSSMAAGSIFGEMAYFGKEKRRTATVIAKTDVVVRKISTQDFSKLPAIIKIFKRIASRRRREFAREATGPQDGAFSPRPSAGERT